jgi:hypothetical protein
LALPLRLGCNMRCSHSFLSSLLVLATPAAVGAETTIYLMGPVEVPPPLVLLVGGLALLGLGALSRRWRARARPPEPERSDGLEPAFLSPMIVGVPVSDAAQTTITSVVAASSSTATRDRVPGSTGSSE